MFEKFTHSFSLDPCRLQAHNHKELYDFHAYMVRSLEDEFQTIVGIR